MSVTHANLCGTAGRTPRGTLVRDASAFDLYADEYDRWFDENLDTYEAEVRALHSVVPEGGDGLEIGVGTGRFAARLGIRYGVEPARGMVDIASRRGIVVCRAVGERLPFADGVFDYAALITVVCFVADPEALFLEVRRTLRPGGHLVVAFIDRDTPLGRLQELRRQSHRFYRQARFYSSDDVARLVASAGFADYEWRQTAFDESSAERERDEVTEGRGIGAFVVLSARKTLG